MQSGQTLNYRLPNTQLSLPKQSSERAGRSNGGIINIEQALLRFSVSLGNDVLQVTDKRKKPVKTHSVSKISARWVVDHQEARYRA